MPGSMGQTDFVVSQKTTIDKFDNFIPEIDENINIKRDLNKSLHLSAPNEKNGRSIPIVQPRRRISSKSSQSILDIVEEEKIEANPQAVFSDDILSTSLPSKTSIPDYGAQESPEHSVLEGIMGSWFFKNKSIEEDNVGGTIQRGPEMAMEGIGGGELTSKVVSALNLKQTSKIEGGKMNAWVPASF